MNGLIRADNKFKNLKDVLKRLSHLIDRAEKLIKSNDFDKCFDSDNSITAQISEIKVAVLSKDLKFSEQEAALFTDLMERSEKFHDDYRKLQAEQDLTNKIEKINVELSAIKELRSNILTIFGIFVGISGYIFSSFNVFKNIGNLPLTHIITVVVFFNLSFVGGITALSVLLKSILLNDSLEIKPILWFLCWYFIISIAIISLLHYDIVLWLL